MRHLSRTRRETNARAATAWCPVNAACQQRVHAIARGELKSSVDTVRTLAADFGVL